MNKPSTVRLIVLAFLVSMLANTFGWSFNGKMFTHELAHHHHRKLFLINPDVHLELHHALDGSVDLDAATHLCLHAASQLQAFYPPPLLQINVVDIGEAVLEIVDSTFPETIPDRLYHPPRPFS
ncbi:hypothetical protein ABO04_02210 [Nitrosomonas sp. HPC101]|uniref:hypothetical protein n=1 Tax=Nitrosomonas sp. HPC101 TaxID=1658667 RepID=UPI001368B143|nr:hypothetical protein [Nitrosomonas sp. HPC101]MXS84757.1 hypothetical protein [Nitrosomonas sp. HPC101]